MSPVESVTPLNEAQLRASIADQLVGNVIVVLEETTSTNDVVAEMAATHRPGLVVFAETQTAARGQYGRRWESAAGKGLWLSVLLRPQIPVGDSALLTDLLARAVAATIEEQAGLQCSIKAPNDVYFGAQKIAGVLVEMRVEANGGYAAIAGIGLNVNQTREDFPPPLRDTAGSLWLATGRLIDRTLLAIALLKNLETRYAARQRELRA
jgi:BirA family biotin operon repressor/biotin-[acetyl-CoA-carboxylase] ligase